MLHQARQYAHWIAIRDPDQVGTGLMQQIRDIVTGEDSYFVYGSPEEMKGWETELIACEKAKAAEERKVERKKILEGKIGHGGVRRAGSRAAPHQHSKPNSDAAYQFSCDEYLSGRTEALFEPDPDNKGCQTIFYQKVGVAKFVATPLFIEIWEKLLTRFGNANFTEVLNTVCGSTGHTPPQHWTQLNPRLGTGRLMGRVSPEETRHMTPFALLVIEGIKRLKAGFQPNGLNLKLGRNQFAIVSKPNASAQRMNFDEEIDIASWLFNCQGEYSFDFWPRSHTTMDAVDACSERDGMCGRQVPKQFRDHPTKRMKIQMEEFSLVIFSAQLLHRGTKNTTGALHCRFFGTLEGLAARAGKQSRFVKITEKRERNSNTYFLKPEFERLFLNEEDTSDMYDISDDELYEQ